MRNKILVTGAGGQLGTELKDASAFFPEYEFIFLSRKELAIENEDEVDAYFKHHEPLFCINCAAYTAVDKAEADYETAYLINGAAVGILAAASEKYGSKLIHVSTDYVFNGISVNPYREDDPVDPVNLYGASKLKGEQLAMDNSNGNTVIIRTSWVYSIYGNNFVKTMTRLMKERESIKVVNDQFGSPTYAADLAAVIMAIIRSGKWEPGIYHFSNEGVITWYEFASAIKELTGSACHVLPVPSTEYPTPAKRPGYSVMDKEKIKATYSVALNEWKQSLDACIRALH
ncbi:MAG: dTDP-4-dehydrorhamnose reductase [Chitinophagaceae bacterium]|nr:dTDP-4-dehydrorhamnose reductase [Chitinophagaceae bacterium]